MLVGRTLNERYQVKKIIGSGGMADVYLATDMILDRDVAIKVLRLEYANDEEFIARFDREAQAATSLSHPNVVNIYDVGGEENILYMVMEYVDGMTLKEYIQRFGPIEVSEAVSIMKQITAAISHAHANDLVHRDIKPQNILLDKHGNVKVTDFGIAIALSATSLTQTNSILGSVHYLSPEQARGGSATKKSDIYSLGIVFYELLTGKLPFSGQTPVSIALKHLQADTPSVRKCDPHIPQSIENIVLKATAKDPLHRFDTVAELENALNEALNPNNLEESLFTPPIEPGEATKIIPVITSAMLDEKLSEDTITHQMDTAPVVNPEKASTSKQTVKPQRIKKNKKKQTIWWVSGAIVALLALVSLALLILPGLLQPKEVVVTDVIDWEYAEAKDEMERLKLIVEREFVYDEEIEADHIVKTDPKPGRTIRVDSTITLFVSQGKEKVVFGDYAGREFSQVERLLTEQNYKDVVAWEKYSDQPAGEILAQIQPDAGGEVIPDETQVIFEVSAGPEPISLNSLKGMTKAEVEKYLQREGLLLTTTKEHSPNVPADQVIRHDPEANTELKRGATVNVVLSLGPKEDPPVYHSVTFTVPYKQMDVPEQVPDETENEENGEVQPLEPVEQKVLIYIGDMEHNIENVFKEDYITADKEYTITLTIQPNSDAKYKVTRDDEIIIDEKKSY